MESQSVVLSEVDEQQLDAQVQWGKNAIMQASRLPMETAGDMEVASAMRGAIKDRQSAIKGLLEPFIKAAHALHKSHTTRRKEIIAPLEEAEGILNKKMVAWQTAEEARIAEEQKKLDEQAKLDAAVEAEQEGNEALAEAIIEDQVPVTAPPVEKAKTNGVNFSNTWTYEITDESAIPREYLIPDEKAIKAVVKAQKDRCKIPGIRVFAQKGIKSARKDMSKTSF
jgi:hypothetical protein